MDSVCSNCSNLIDDYDGYYDDDKAIWICEMCLCPCCYANASTECVNGITYCVKCADEKNK